MTWIAPALTSFGLLCLVLATVLVVSRRLRRVSAVAALRSGARGSGRGPGRLRLHRSPLPVGITLGLMDVTRRLGMYSLLLVVVAVCAMIVTVPAATSGTDRKSTRLNSSHVAISYAVFCLKKKKNNCKRTTS